MILFVHIFSGERLEFNPKAKEPQKHWCAETKNNNRHGPCFFTRIRKTVTKDNHLLYFCVAYARLLYHVQFHTILSIEKPCIVNVW
jgi:hypothetical protein